MTNQERERPAYSTVEDCPEQLKKGAGSWRWLQNLKRHMVKVVETNSEPGKMKRGHRVKSSRVIHFL